jgi:hypothetical protein
MIGMTLPQYRRHECTINGRTVRLFGECTTKACIANGCLNRELLALLLVSPPDRYLCRDDLIEALWPDNEPDWATAIVHRLIHALRGLSVPIETSYTFGYRIPRWAREQRQIAEAA